MKYVYVLSGLVCICLFLCGLTSGLATKHSLDLSTPKVSFQSLQKAVSKTDLAAIELILADIPGATPKHQIAPNVIKMYKDNIPLEKFILIGTEEGEGLSFGCPRAWIWVKWPEGKIRGCLNFIKQDAEWRLFIPVFGFIEYDLSTPKRAFLSILGAQSPAHEDVTVSDVQGMYEVLASDLKDVITSDEYKKLVKMRKKQRRWILPDFSYDTDHLEEEMLEPENEKAHCKVWKLDKQGKHVGFEIFIKEGEEWKWIPDPKYIWFPTKLGKKENQQVP